MTVATLFELDGKPMMDKKDADKAKALESALAQIERQFGKGSIMKLGQNNAVMDVEAISTGSLGLDIALGIGGLPKGRIIEIYGPESSGKTTLTLHVVAEAQKNGGVCAFVDAEHALDIQYAQKLGVNLNDLLVSQPDNGEQALDICETLAKSGAVDVIVIDSVAALTSTACCLSSVVNGDSKLAATIPAFRSPCRKLARARSRSTNAAPSSSPASERREQRHRRHAKLHGRGYMFFQLI